MQAQATGGGGSILQNPKVQIGVIAGGALALIGVVVMLIMSNGGAAPAPTPSPGAGDPTPPSVAGPAGGPGSPITPPPPAGGAPGTPMASSGPVGASGVAGAPGAPGAAKEGAVPKKGAGVPVRANPFAENKELLDVLAGIPPDPKTPDVVAQEHRLYQDELHTPAKVVDVTDDDQNDGPPIPTMRVAGVVYGKQISATLQIGDQYMQVTPGQMVPASNPIYRVDRIEQETVHLSRRWEMGDRKGVQRIEVGLTALAANPGGAAFRAPGAAGGYPGYPGAGGVPNF